MSLTVTCPQCQARYRLPEGSEGKKMKCPKCSERFTVPLPNGAESEKMELAVMAAAPAQATASERPTAAPDQGRDAEDDYEYAEADDAPRKRKPSASEFNLVALLMAALVGMFMVCTYLGFYLYLRRDQPGNVAGPPLAVAVGNAGGIEFVRPAQPGQVNRPEQIAWDNMQRLEAKLQDPNARIEVPGPAIEVAFGADGSFRQANSLTAQDPDLADKRYKLYLVPMAKGKTYQIDMESGQIDSYLRLLSPDGRVLAQDDDSGGNLNSRIYHQATEDGKYKLVATSFNPKNQPNATGPFTISIRLHDGPVPVAGPRMGGAVPVPGGVPGPVPLPQIKSQ
jgi:predicted Zn finger-like uncharacterized protein